MKSKIHKSNKINQKFVLASLLLNFKINSVFSTEKMDKNDKKKHI